MNVHCDKLYVTPSEQVSEKGSGTLFDSSSPAERDVAQEYRPRQVEPELEQVVNGSGAYNQPAKALDQA